LSYSPIIVFCPRSPMIASSSSASLLAWGLPLVVG